MQFIMCCLSFMASIFNGYLTVYGTIHRHLLCFKIDDFYELYKVYYNKCLVEYVNIEKLTCEQHSYEIA